MKNYLLTLTAVLLALNSGWAGGGGITDGGGGGLTELRFVAVWLGRSAFVLPCTAVGNPCRLLPAELQTLAKMRENSNDEKNLVFVSAAKNPGPFGGSVKSVIGTKPEVGASVYVNLDALYTTALMTDYSFPMTYLVAAWAYHQQFAWTQALTLGQKVAAFWQQKSETYNLYEYGIRDLEVQVFESFESFVFVLDQNKVSEISSMMKKGFHCSNGFAGQALLRLQNGSWEQFSPKPAGAEAIFSGNIVYTCANSQGLRETWSGGFRMWLPFEKQGEGLSLLLPQLRITFQDLVRSQANLN